jgi:GNAT superfamily N-acetyltransferase
LVRLATRADATELAALRYEFRAGLLPAVEPREEFQRRCGAWMAERLADPLSGWRCWVAQAEATLAGHVWLCLIDKVPNPVAEPERHGYVTNLFVLPRFRGDGTGGRLLGEALTWCRERRVDAVILWPTPESRSLYARHGFSNQTGLMELRRSGA